MIQYKYMYFKYLHKRRDSHRGSHSIFFIRKVGRLEQPGKALVKPETLSRMAPLDGGKAGGR